MWYRAGADLVVVVHLMFIGFIVGGVFLTWRWPVIIWAHLPAVAYGALVEFAGLTCPLTLLENDLHHRAGEAGYRGGFISHYLVTVIYPPGLTHEMQIGLGVLLLMLATIGYWGYLRRHGLAIHWFKLGIAHSRALGGQAVFQRRGCSNHRLGSPAEKGGSVTAARAINQLLAASPTSPKSEVSVVTGPDQAA